MPLAQLPLAQLFNGANLFVLPFWALMILLPNWSVTRRVMGSLIPFVVLAVLYLSLLVSTITPESAQALANPQLADIARFFAAESAAATGWVHFLVMDLFVGRWIYWEGQRTGVWTIHSIALCLFAGPLGLLSHILTTWITQTFTASLKPEAATATPPVSPES
ncbi:MAG TPA: ABA4-like family protein [Allocoleopsis sp.]